MRLTNFLLSSLSVATLGFAFSACDTSKNVAVNNAASNSVSTSNTTIAANTNSTAANNAAPASNTSTSTNISANTSESPKEDGKFEGNYLVGYIKCKVTPDKDGVRYEVKCADQEKVQIYFRKDPSDKQAVIVSEDEKSRFVFDDKTLSTGSFIDEAGKTIVANRIP
jgi:hypothetical protein